MSLEVSCAGCGSLLKYESENFTGDARSADEQRALSKWLEGHNCCLIANGLGIGKPKAETPRRQAADTHSICDCGHDAKSHGLEPSATTEIQAECCGCSCILFVPALFVPIG